MGFDVVVRENPIRRRDPRLADEFEQAVSEVLEREGAGPVHVRFHVWEGAQDGLKYACKVECPAAQVLEPRELPWRWWSALVEAPVELADALSEALSARGMPRTRPGHASRRSMPLPAGAWGWGPKTLPGL